MTTAEAVATRSSADIQGELDELTAQIPAARSRLEAIRLERKTRRSELRSADAAAVRAGTGPTDPVADEAAVELARLDRVVAAQEQALLDDQERLGALQRDHGLALGREMVELEDKVLQQFYPAREKLLAACMQVLLARGEEHALDVGLHQVKTELDQIAEKTGESSFRRGVFAFGGAYRPALNGIGNQIEQLCKELNVSIDSAGRITPLKTTK